MQIGLRLKIAYEESPRFESEAGGGRDEYLMTLARQSAENRVVGRLWGRVWRVSAFSRGSSGGRWLPGEFVVVIAITNRQSG